MALKKVRARRKALVGVCFVVLVVGVFACIITKVSLKLIVEQESHRLCDELQQCGYGVLLAAVWQRLTFALGNEDAGRLHLDTMGHSCDRIYRYGAS